MSDEKYTRREFVKRMGSMILGLVSFPLISLADQPNLKTKKQPLGSSTSFPDLVVAQGRDPAELVRKALQAYGGMKRFVKKGDVVVVKPNIAWDRLPAQAANTNPDVVKALVELAYEAGAKKVKVFDNTVNNPQSCYRRSGIMEKAQSAGAEVKFINPALFTKVKFSGTKFLTEWPIYKEALDCDVLINVPVAKTHGISTLTMALKNLMGIIGGARGRWHPQIHQALADLITKVRPQLTVLDAYRIMIKNGPTGGSVKDVKFVGKCIIGTDQVAVDSYGATLFGYKPQEIGYLRIANEMKLGEINLSKLHIKEIKV
ncbi:DUF362 domain-containing protein [Candidatus Sumerlaeota bacterium]|nr:DUF362 domain-containing protein [Candidatus Sumerlaeota bacterium]